MHPAALIILVLSNTGYWLSGTDCTVTARWAVPDHTPQANLIWELEIDSIRLDGGSCAIKSGGDATELKLKCPAVRVRTPLEFRYRIVSGDGKQQLGGGTAIINAFATDLTDGWPALLGDRSLVVVDSPRGVPGLLSLAKVKFTRADSPLDLQLGHPDLVMVGEDQLDDSPFAQSALLAQARAGSCVVIFEQTHVSRLTGFALSHRTLPDHFEWNLNHPLLAHFSTDDVSSWLNDQARDLLAIRSRGDQPVTAVARWPGESPDEGDRDPSDALITTQTIGAGRIVLCQLHLDHWQTDPRTVLLVGNILDYLSTQPRQTLSAGRRVIPMAASATRHLTVQILAGDKS